jgi:CheY-like chemotaxis protein
MGEAIAMKKILMKKILVVDDSCTARLVNRMIFSQKSNYELLSAADGKEAVDKAREARPDLILMDVVMPQMNGLEACRVLKKTTSRSH